MTKLMLDRLQREKPSSYLKHTFHVQYNYAKGVGCLFLLSIGHMFGHVLYHLKGTKSRC